LVKFTSIESGKTQFLIYYTFLNKTIYLFKMEAPQVRGKKVHGCGRDDSWSGSGKSEAGAVENQQQDGVFDVGQRGYQTG